jgi:hypothetical protein
VLRGFSPGSSFPTGLSASQPRRTAKPQTWLSAISTVRAVVGASARSLASDQAATRSDEVVRRLVQRRQATLAQPLRQCREHDLPLGRLRLWQT